MQRKQENRRRSACSRALRHLCWYFPLSVILCVLLLLMGTLLPQDRIDYRMKQSIDTILGEGLYPRIGDHEESSQLDSWTEALILMQSTSMDRPVRILTNPQWSKPDPVEALWKFYEAKESEKKATHYVRYWLGFRTPVRLLMQVLNYTQIRKLLSWILYGLIIAVSYTVAQKTDKRAGILFAVSIILFKPQIICQNIQFCCDFFIAFAAMLILPKVNEKGEMNMLLFFFEIGLLTMYFDFYTTPIITLGYPLLFYYLLPQKQDSRKVSSMWKAVLFWIMGYAGMWLIKLCLVTVFTDIDGFANGFNSMFKRVGVNKMADSMEEYSILGALNAVFQTCFPERTERICLLLLLPVTIIVLFQKRTKLGRLLQYGALLIPLLLSAIWIAAAAQPTTQHAWFQHRLMASAFYGFLLWMSSLWKPFSEEKTSGLYGPGREKTE